jgi:hypothetical protein
VAPPRPPLPIDYRWEIPLLALLGLMPGIWFFRQWRSPRREAMTTGAPPTTLEQAAAILPEMTGGPPRVFAAVLLDLATRGHVELRRVDWGKGIFKIKKVEVVRREVAGDPLTPFEQRLLDEIARYDSLTDFGLKARRFRRDVVKEMREAAIGQGLIEDHSRRSGLLLAAAALIEAAAVALLITSAIRPRGAGYPVLPWGVLLVGLSSGLFLPAFLFRTTTETGSLLRAQVLAYLASLRQEVGQLAQASPIEGARAYIQDLPWLTLDAKVTAYWVQKLAAALKKADGELPTPGWAIDATGGATSGSAAYVAFMPYVHVTTAAAGAASPGAGGAGSSGGAGAGGGGGAAAAGAAPDERAPPRPPHPAGRLRRLLRPGRAAGGPRGRRQGALPAGGRQPPRPGRGHVRVL